MDTKMGVTVTACAETFTAYFASKWFCSTMHPKMHIKCALSRETFITKWTCKGPVSSMHRKMTVVVAVCAQAVALHRIVRRFSFVMETDKLVTARLLGETLPIHCTFKCSLSLQYGGGKDLVIVPLASVSHALYISMYHTHKSFPI